MISLEEMLLKIKNGELKPEDVVAYEPKREWQNFEEIKSMLKSAVDYSNYTALSLLLKDINNAYSSRPTQPERNLIELENIAKYATDRLNNLLALDTDNTDTRPEFKSYINEMHSNFSIDNIDYVYDPNKCNFTENFLSATLEMPEKHAYDLEIIGLLLFAYNLFYRTNWDASHELITYETFFGANYVDGKPHWFRLQQLAQKNKLKIICDVIKRYENEQTMSDLRADPKLELSSTQAQIVAPLQNSKISRLNLAIACDDFESVQQELKVLNKTPEEIEKAICTAVIARAKHYESFYRNMTDYIKKLYPKYVEDEKHDKILTELIWYTKKYCNKDVDLTSIVNSNPVIQKIITAAWTARYRDLGYYEGPRIFNIAGNFFVIATLVMIIIVALGVAAPAFIPLIAVPLVAGYVYMHRIFVAARLDFNKTFDYSNYLNEYSTTDLVRTAMNCSPDELQQLLLESRPDPSGPEFKAAIDAAEYSSEKNQIKLILKEYQQAYNPSIPSFSFPLTTLANIETADKLCPGFSEDLLTFFSERLEILTKEASKVQTHIKEVDDTDFKFLKLHFNEIMNAAKLGVNEFIDAVEKYHDRIVAAAASSENVPKKPEKNDPLIRYYESYCAANAKLEEDLKFLRAQQNLPLELEEEDKNENKNTRS